MASIMESPLAGAMNTKGGKGIWSFVLQIVKDQQRIAPLTLRVGFLPGSESLVKMRLPNSLVGHASSIVSKTQIVARLQFAKSALTASLATAHGLEMELGQLPQRLSSQRKMKWIWLARSLAMPHTLTQTFHLPAT